jgi:hypothetical protein
LREAEPQRARFRVSRDSVYILSYLLIPVEYALVSIILPTYYLRSIILTVAYSVATNSTSAPIVMGNWLTAAAIASE